MHSTRNTDNCDGHTSDPSQKVVTGRTPPVTEHKRVFIGEEHHDPVTGRPHVTRARVSGDLPVTIQKQLATWGLSPTAVQCEAIGALAGGLDVLAVWPTGAGKSLPPQTITAVRPELGLRATLVISPLIALGADQDQRADKLDLYSAIWNSKIRGAVKHEIIQRLQADDIDILFTTPESLCGRLGELARGHVGLVWVDEGHVAISGRHFREAWAICGEIVAAVNPRLRYCCTATCRRAQQDEIIRRCGLRDPVVIRIPPERPELRYLHVQRDIDSVCDVVRRHRGQRVLVYVATRRAADDLYAQLDCCGYRVGCYHGGMGGKGRAAVQDAFGKRDVDVVVATDAFGLGIDYPDIRAVVLYDPASDVSAFVQQAGRAGRDGRKAVIYVCSRGSEDGWDSRRYLVQSSFPAIEDIRAAWTFLKLRSVPAPIAAIARGCAMHYEQAESCVRWLRRKGLVSEASDNADRRRLLYRAVGDFNATDWDDHEAEQAEALAALDELQAMWGLSADEIPAAIVRAFEN